MSGLSFTVVGAAPIKRELIYIWTQATPEAQADHCLSHSFFHLAWSVMVSKAIQVPAPPPVEPLFQRGIPRQKSVLNF